MNGKRASRRRARTRHFSPASPASRSPGGRTSSRPSRPALSSPPAAPSTRASTPRRRSSPGASLADGAIQDASNPGGDQVHYGIREHAMAAAMSGMALHGGVLPIGGTFFIFSDYMRPSVRLAALSKAHSIFFWSHDSVGLGPDGPTHQPIEH